MDDMEFIKMVGKLYQEYLDTHKNEDFEINQKQLKKLHEVYYFFLDKAKEYEGGFVEPLKLVPKEEFGDVVARFPIFSLNGTTEVSNFCEILDGCSAFGVDPVIDGICIDCTVPKVFIPKDNLDDPE